jgi:gas vesicle protein
MLLGGAVGFTLGILLAPESGDKVRRRVAYRLERLIGQLGTLIDHIVSPESENEARRTGDALVEDAKLKAEQIRADIDALLGELQRQGSPN